MRAAPALLRRRRTATAPAIAASTMRALRRVIRLLRLRTRRALSARLLGLLAEPPQARPQVVQHQPRRGARSGDGRDEMPPVAHSEDARLAGADLDSDRALPGLPQQPGAGLCKCHRG